MKTHGLLSNDMDDMYTSFKQLVDRDHDFDLEELTNNFQKMYDDLDTRYRKMLVIEAIAMNSNDPNIKEMRRQLFTTTMLIHSDDIDHVLEEFSYDLQRQYDDGSCEPVSQSTKKQSEKEKLFSRISRYFWWRRSKNNKNLKSSINNSVKGR